ncbi:MAG TPA: hypothetical protein VM165_26195 [Planctomycetaceae bacterium]|nr:hypothetical protein [Planctomycetaceae bacterium]
MPKKRRSPAKSQSLALWQIGLLLMIAGPLAYVFLDIVWPLKPPLTNEQRGAAFGRGLASVLSMIAGAVMVALHFVRRKRR